MEFKKGKTHHIYKGPGGKPYKIHILEIIDLDYVVFKWYGRYKQGWHYEIEHKTVLEAKIDRVKSIRKN